MLCSGGAALTGDGAVLVGAGAVLIGVVGDGAVLVGAGAVLIGAGPTEASAVLGCGTTAGPAAAAARERESADRGAGAGASRSMRAARGCSAGMAAGTWTGAFARCVRGACTCQWCRKLK